MTRAYSTFFNKNITNFWFYTALGFFILVLVTNAVAIRVMPSWLDEAFFSDIVFNLSHGSGFRVEIIPGQENPIYIYGPIFFVLQKLVGFILEFGEVSARIIDFGSGVLIAALFGFLVYSSTRSRHYSLLTFTLIIGDVSVNSSMYLGRMDLLATLYVVLSYMVVRRALVNAGWASLLGLFMALAILTTPRSIFLLFGVAAYIGFLSIKIIGRPGWIRRIFITYSWTFLALAVLWGSWILWVGGFANYIDLNSEANIKSHWGISIFRSWYDNIAILLMLLLVATCYQKIKSNLCVLSFFVSFLAFSFFAKQIGPYAGMVMPFVYAIIASILQSAIRGMNKWYKYFIVTAILSIFGVQASVMVAKISNLYIYDSCRDHVAFQNKILANIPHHQTVLSEFRYYFAVRKQKPSVFEVIEFNNPEHIIEKLKPGYILLNTSKIEHPKDGTEKGIAALIATEYQPLERFGCTAHSLGRIGNYIASRAYGNQEKTFKNATLFKRRPDS